MNFDRTLFYTVLIPVFSLLFYLAVPGIGAFHVRRRWRRFRRHVVRTSMYPTIRYGDFIHTRDEGFVGYYRFVGSLEAIQGSDTAWIHDGAMSVSAKLSGVPVHVLPASSLSMSEEQIEQHGGFLGDETPQHMTWNRISTLPEGTRIMLSGTLYSERGHAVFRDTRSVPLMVLLFDGDERTVLRRAIWSGRQKNEYWNQFTLSSLLAGTVALFVLAYYFSRSPMLRPQAILALVAGAAPILPFLPPGIGLFFVYRYVWGLGRVRRAERDVLALPVRYFGDDETPTRGEVVLPDGEIYVARRVDSLEEAHRLAPSASIREVPQRLHASGHEYWVFGTPGASGVSAPSDSMAEHLLVPANPWRASKVCDRHARALEVLALVSFALGICGNAILTLYVLAGWLR